eukprot:scaffold134441_cov69-Attheya_sp.AAC.3
MKAAEGSFSLFEIEEVALHNSPVVKCSLILRMGAVLEYIISGSLCTEAGVSTVEYIDVVESKFIFLGKLFSIFIFKCYRIYHGVESYTDDSLTPIPIMHDLTTPVTPADWSYFDNRMRWMHAPPVREPDAPIHFTKEVEKLCGAVVLSSIP